MTTPDLTLTMLGTTSSGKTTFLLGMYDILSAGLHGYFTFTEDPDQAVDLRDAWDLLIDEGELPPPNDADRAGTTASSSTTDSRRWSPSTGWITAAARSMTARTRGGRPRAAGAAGRSDSIYLVLDGGSLATWLDDPAKLTVVQRKLKVQAMSAQVLQAVTNRRQNGLPFPSLAVIITKADLLRGPDRSVGQALARWSRLRELLPVVWADGITALVCPVKVGDFGRTRPASWTSRPSTRWACTAR